MLLPKQRMLAKTGRQNKIAGVKQKTQPQPHHRGMAIFDNGFDHTRATQFFVRQSKAASSCIIGRMN
jgi:hypothetical protein